MLFISDLDRTLIYSSRFVAQSSRVHEIEEYEGKTISYMTEKSVQILKKLLKNKSFIPATTRTIQQYRRIHIFHKNIPKHAIVSNGGNILVNDRVDEKWKSYIRNEIKHSCINIEEVKNKFSHRLFHSWIKKVKTADDLFVYCIVDPDSIPHDEVQSFKEDLSDKGWRTFLQGRKLYFIPRCVSKKTAAKYILNQYEDEEVFAAGDSLVDLDMAEIASYFISPRHGEVYIQRKSLNKKIKQLEVSFTEQEGITAAEEILEQVMEKYEEYNIEEISG